MAIAEEIAGTPPMPRIHSGHMARVRDLAFQPGGRLLASASDDETIRLWDVFGGRELRSLDGHQHKVLCTTFTPDGVSIVSGSRDGTMIVWDAGDWRPIAHAGRR